MNKTGEKWSRINVSSKRFNYNYMELVVYETCEKLIWILVKGLRNTNTIRKKAITKVNNNKTSLSSTLGFGSYPQKDTCDILSGALFCSYYNHIHHKTRELYLGI